LTVSQELRPGAERDEPAVLVIGAGGLGCPAVFALAAAGIMRIGIMDDDRVDESNIHRQYLHGVGSMGRLKVESLADALAQRFPEVTIVRHATRFAIDAVERLAAYDAVIDASDNFATKFLLNDAAVLAGVPLVHGAAVGLGGQMMTILPGGRPCYRCLFEEMPPPGVGPSCAEAGVLGPVPGVIGALQGVEAARLSRGEVPAFANQIIQYDSASMTVRSVRLRPNPACGVCGTVSSQSGAMGNIGRLDPSRYLEPACHPPSDPHKEHQK
jgi:molybdopterin/thiamine biosynthesis adenylyltransferase